MKLIRQLSPETVEFQHASTLLGLSEEELSTPNIEIWHYREFKRLSNSKPLEYGYVFLVDNATQKWYEKT